MALDLALSFALKQVPLVSGFVFAEVGPPGILEISQTWEYLYLCGEALRVPTAYNKSDPSSASAALRETWTLQILERKAKRNL